MAAGGQRRDAGDDVGDTVDRNGGGDVGDKLGDAARQAADSRPVDRLSRAGLAARAVVYLMVGYLAGRVALGAAGDRPAATARPASGEGALAVLAARPAGRVALALLAVGFLSYAVLAAVQAAFRQGGQGGAGQAAERWGKRLLYTGVALLYAALCVVTASFIWRRGVGVGSASQVHGRETELTARVLGWPFGQLLVGAFGVALAAAGVGFGYQALTTNFQERLRREQMPAAVWHAATVLGWVGGIARAATLLLVGVFVVSAAVTFDPRKARGLDAALRSVAGRPYGPWLLGAIALGLLAYGLYLGLEIRYRKV